MLLSIDHLFKQLIAVCHTSRFCSAFGRAMMHWCVPERDEPRGAATDLKLSKRGSFGI